MPDHAPQPFLLAADAVISMDSAQPKVLPNAGIVVTGNTITAVGELADLRRRFGNLPHDRERLRGTLLPGFINAHTHLEHSHRNAAELDNSHFTRWISSLMAHYPPPEQLEAVTRAAVRKGVVASLFAGVTTIGDISRHCAITRSELAARVPSAPAAPAAAPLPVPRVVSYGEVVALGKMRDRLTVMLDAALPPPPAPPPLDAEQAKIENQKSKVPPTPGPPPRLMLGVSPHAPYTVEGPALRKVVSRAYIRGAPVAMHLAELAEEADFLRDLSGPLGREWDLMLKLDVIDDLIPHFPTTGHGRGGPIRWAQRWGLLVADRRNPREARRNLPVLLAHVNYCDNAELSQLAACTASIAYCPRTHAYFKHPPHRYRDMLAAEINVCLGTDSLASNPDLSVLKEAQLLHQRDQLDPHTALEMITRRAAVALGLGEYAGTLSPGKFADVQLLPTTAKEPDAILQEILNTAPEPTALWIDGEQLLPARAS